MSFLQLPSALRRGVWSFSCLSLAWIGAPLWAQTGTPSAADGFNPTVTGTVNAVAVGPGGEIAIGGAFLSVQPGGGGPVSDSSGLQVLNEDGTIDTAFATPFLEAATSTSAGTPAQISAVAFQPDGSLLVGGNFTVTNPVTGAVLTYPDGTPCQYLVRFTAAGAVDMTFEPALAGRVMGAVTAIYVYPAGSPNAGQILIGGDFDTSVATAYPASKYPSAANYLINANHLARLNANGTLDTSFAASTNAQVDAFGVDSTGNIYIGGAFTQVVVSGFQTARGFLAKLSPTGQLDPNFDPEPNESVSGIAMEPNGEAVIVGQFTTLSPGLASNPSVTAITAAYVAKLYTSSGPAGSNIQDGNPDPNFSPQSSSAINTVVILPNGQIVIGGLIGTITTNGAATVTQSYLVRLDDNGIPDTTFNPEPNGEVNALAVQPDGKIVIGGAFTQFFGPTEPTPVPRSGLARVDENGILDADFNPNAYGGIAVIMPVTYPNSTTGPAGNQTQKFLVGGSFTSIGGVSVTNLALLNADGSVDTQDFSSPNPDGTVLAIGVESDSGHAGDIIIGGNFQNLTYPNVVNQPYLARLTAKGALDSTYNPQPNGEVSVITMQSNGQALVGGSFTEFTPTGGPSSSAPTNGSTTTDIDYVGRLGTDGSVDTTFEPQPSGVVSAIVIVPNSNWIVIAGDFTSVTPASTATTSSAYYIARLGANNGAFDPTFIPEFDGPINELVYEPNDGKFVIAGSFQNYVTSVVVGASETTEGGVITTDTSRPGMARLNSDGSLDQNYNPAPNGAVLSLAIDPVQYQILVGGRFSSIGTTNTGAQTTSGGPTTTTVPGNPIGGGTLPTSQANLARLNTDGTLDVGFLPQVNGPVTALYVDSNHNVYAGGTFTSVTTGGTIVKNTVTGGTTYTAYHLAEFNDEGQFETAFQASTQLNATVNSIAVEPNGELLVAGQFTNINGTYATNLARFWPDGTVDTFGADTDGPVFTTATVANGSSIYVGGAFSGVGGGYQNNLARLNFDGTLDTTFAPTVNGPVYAMMIDEQGRLVIGGAFTSVNGQQALYVARVTQTGALDTSFTASANGPVYALALADNLSMPQLGGSGAQNPYIYIGGAFTQVNGGAYPYLARLTANGATDPSFAPLPNNAVKALALLPDGTLAVGGNFTAIAFTAQRYFADLATTGQASSASAALALNGPVDAIVLENRSQNTSSGGTPQSLDPIVIGGSFTSVGGVARNNVARLVWTAAGAPLSVDSSFNPNANGTVSALAMAPDGKVYLGGNFSTVGGLPRSSIARVAATGPMAQSITLGSDVNSLTYTLSGEAPELSSVVFQTSPDLVNWTSIGPGIRSSTLNNTWTITGINGQLLNGYTYVRTLASAVDSGYTSESSLGMTQQLYAPSSLSSSSQVSIVANQPYYYFIAATQFPTGFSATGLPAGLTINPFTGAISGTPTAAPGTYVASITMTNAAGANTVQITFTVTAAPSSTAVNPATRLLNISTNGSVTPGDPVVDGFAISGTAPKMLLLRGDGPSLSNFGISTGLTEPVLTLYDSHGRQLLQVQAWDDTSEMAKITARVGAFPLGAASADSAIVTTLPPGVYSMQITSGNGGGGQALAEVYDADPSPFDTASHLVNVSGNGTVADGATPPVPLIAGVVIGSAPNNSSPPTKTLLVRALGPALAAFVATPLPDPILTFYGTNGAIIASNQGWQNGPTLGTLPAGVTVRAATVTDFQNAGTFTLTPGSADDAFVITGLPAGSYTAMVTSANNNTDTATVEIYDLGP